MIEALQGLLYLLSVLGLLIILIMLGVFTAAAARGFMRGFRSSNVASLDREEIAIAQSQMTPDIAHSSVWNAPEPAPPNLEQAFEVCAMHGEKMHRCTNCQSTRTNMTRVGYRYNPRLDAMVVIVAERCMECDQRIHHTMTGFSWACAMLRAELSAWTLAQESADLNFEVQQDLSDLDMGPDGPTK